MSILYSYYKNCSTNIEVGPSGSVVGPLITEAGGPTGPWDSWDLFRPLASDQ